jgi:hypothetical protein
VGIEFLAATTNGIDVQSGDACDGRVAAVADLFGLNGRDPATLLFIEALEEQIHLLMQLLFGVIQVAQTKRALAQMKRVVVHDGLSATKMSAAEHVVCS